MSITKLPKALSQALRKFKPLRKDINHFKTGLAACLNNISIAEENKEHEENFKKYIADFLKNSLYQDHLINTKERIDLAIYSGQDANSHISVLIEVKRPSNTSEFPTANNINKKALHELLLYYLQERVDKQNNNIKHLIATNGYEWYLFKGEDFYTHFYKNAALQKEYKAFRDGEKDSTKNELFYQEIAKKYLEQVGDALDYVYFNVQDYTPYLDLDNKKDNKLVSLYKTLSSTHLLNKAFGNDSNQLNKVFYEELLHLIGLEEVKEKGKKVIQRLPKGKRDYGSLLESTIFTLESKDYLRKTPDLRSHGSTKEEQLFSVGLELCLTWINRVLFIKLLESQLLDYHGGNKNYRFLHQDFIKGFDDLEDLFFLALAKKRSERYEHLQDNYQYIPYLNSSLFEPNELERDVMQLSNVKDKTMQLYSKTVLKDGNNKRLTGSKDTLAYLFEFLEAYDFSTDNKNEVEEGEQSKALINASVLGLIFEKINGYKDGSFYTPSYITMYMSRETLRRAVVQKMNAHYKWTCTDFEDLKEDLIDHIKEQGKERKKARLEANTVINKLKICDPAVGSGHFLVSCLNELIAIKSDLNILCDAQGERLYTFITLENDELVLEDENGDFFTYNPSVARTHSIQKALFHEKQTLIENCLFAVDINPNSVKICRLRLWIELLKNAYYNQDNVLQTLPNIDINIKCGNSLISRFELEDDLKSAFKSKTNPYSLKDYKNAVKEYKNTNDKNRKREIQAIIDTIKGAFKDTLDKQFLKKLAGARGKYDLKNQELTNLKAFGTKIPKKERDVLKKLKTAFEKAQAAKEEILDNVLYQDAFEWRFEFPEVLDNKGAFRGFDVVIGNPPYMRVQAIQKTQPAAKKHYEEVYKVAQGSYDLANIFVEKAVDISNSTAANSYILPHKFFNSASTAIFRDYLTEGQYVDKVTHFGANMIFDEADTYTCIIDFSPTANKGFWCYKAEFKEDYVRKMYQADSYGFIAYEQLVKMSNYYGSNQWIFLDNKIAIDVFEKIYTDSKKLEEVVSLFVGLQTSNDSLYIGELVKETDLSYFLAFKKLGKTFEVEKFFFKPILKGKDVHRYKTLSTSLYVFFPYHIEGRVSKTLSLKRLKNDFPLTYNYVKSNEAIFKARESGKAGKKENWYAHGRENNLTKFDQLRLSSMEICSKHPNVTINDSICHNTKVYSWVKNEEVTESYEYLLAIANSKILWWFLIQTGDTLQGDARTFKTNYLNPFPIPQLVSDAVESKITNQVKKLLTQKQADPNADTSQLEQEIDVLVYQLYNLTYEEVLIVDKDFPLSKAAYERHLAE